MPCGILGLVSEILLLLAAAAAAPAWWTTRRPWWWALPALALVLVAAAAVLTRPVTAAVGRFTDRPAPAVVAGVLAAVVVGGPLATAVLRAVSGRSAPRTRRHQQRGLGPDAAIASAAEVLRGGAWIGALERLAVVTSLLAGWPEGLAVVLAVKGLGRYPELRHPGAAERFIIGTFCSVLWAAGCAGAVRLVIA